jgi:hypothetical protein
MEKFCPLLMAMLFAYSRSAVIIFAAERICTPAAELTNGTTTIAAIAIITTTIMISTRVKAARLRENVNDRPREGEKPPMSK